jgi:hypothetical protein
VPVNSVRLTYFAFTGAAGSECHGAERRAGCRDRGVYSD